MDITVTIDPVAEMIQSGQGVVFDPEFMVVVECEYIKAVRNRTNRKSLFLYHHTYTDRWVVADWLVLPWHGHPTGVMLELESGESIDQLPTPEKMYYRCYHNSKMLDNIFKNMNQRAKARYAKEEFRAQKRKELAKFADKHGFDHYAAALRQGNVPVSTHENDSKHLRTMYERTLDGDA